MVLLILGHTHGGKPHDGIASCVMMFEGHLEVLDEISPGAEGDGGAKDSLVAEHGYPHDCRSSHHVGKDKNNLLGFSVVNCIFALT